MSFSPNIYGKDAQPLDSVFTIKKILAQNGFHTEEKWNISNVPHCYSLDLYIAGTKLHSSGKGISKPLALASGYGELMELIQLGHIWRSKLNVQNGASSSELQSKTIPMEVLLEKNTRWYQMYQDLILKYSGETLTVDEIIQQYADQEGNVQVTPFYCVTTHTWEYLPTAICNTVYQTNGGAAGNTMEEAMVQAISEVVERHFKTRIISENIPAPEIPEEVLKSSSIAYEIIQFLRSSGYHVLVKDCSLGTKFPVIGICLIDSRTGRYHTHFGAHPNFDISLLRTLTESFQGRNLKNITIHEDFCSKPEETMELRHLKKELTSGTSEKSPLFFLDPPNTSYVRTAGFTGKSNAELLRECIDFFQKQGYDVLLRDSSTLGFPTYQVIIPGFSEVFPNRLSHKHNDIRYSSYIEKVLRNPCNSSMDEQMGLMMHFALTKQHNGIPLSSFCFEANIPAKVSPEEDKYLKCAALAYINYSLDRRNAVINYINEMLRIETDKDTEYLICAKRYLSLLRDQYDESLIKETLHRFHKAEIIKKLYGYLEGNRNIMEPLVLQCDMQCKEDCHLFYSCQKASFEDLRNQVNQKAKALSQTYMEKRLLEIFPATV